MGWRVLTHLPARFFLLWATIECGFSLVKELMRDGATAFNRRGKATSLPVALSR
jgi:hypothetical protein